MTLFHAKNIQNHHIYYRSLLGTILPLQHLLRTTMIRHQFPLLLRLPFLVHIKLPLAASNGADKFVRMRKLSCKLPVHQLLSSFDSNT
jgi:hypothetical protein